MVKILIQDDKKFYQCEECGFLYEDREWADKCEGWCKKHKSCNLNITSHGISSQESK